MPDAMSPDPEVREAWDVLLRVMQDEGIFGRKRQRIEDAARNYAEAHAAGYRVVAAESDAEKLAAIRSYVFTSMTIPALDQHRLLTFIDAAAPTEEERQHEQ